MANNLRKFATESEYNSATLNYPSVSWITGTDTVHFDKVSPIPPKKLQLTYSNSSTYDIDCDTATTLTNEDVKGGKYTEGAITNAVIGDCVTEIDYSAFKECSALTSVTIPNSVTSIKNNAFSGCSSLTSVTIPSSVTSISSSVFEMCSSLTSVTIPNSVTSIGGNAFRGCSGLTSIDIPNSVTSIGGSAFYGCSSLTSITVDSNNTVYDSRENCNAIISASTNTLIVGCKNTVIPNSVTSIGNSAFYGCSSLTSIVIPNSVTRIDPKAFNGCSSLTSIDIPNSVTSIGQEAFYNCSGLTSVTVNASTPPTLGTFAFNNTNNCPIYVPAASVEAYKAATNWSKYASRIQAIIE